jgi:hypothetical protein
MKWTEGYLKLYVFYFDGTSWVEIKRDNMCIHPSYPPCWGAVPGGIGLLSRDGNLYLLWRQEIYGTGSIFVERYNGVKWEFLPEPPPWWGIYRDYPEIDNAAIFLTNEGFPGVVYSQSRTRLFMDIWDGFNWVPIDGQISEGEYLAGVTTHTKSVVVSPDGSIYVGYAESLPLTDYIPQGRVLIKRYDVSTGSWVDEYEALYNGAESPSLAKYDGYIYMAEAGGKWEDWGMVHRIYVKRAELPLGRAQFEECFARVVSSKNGIEELMNSDCLVDNMVFYNGFLYDVLKDNSRTLRERVFAGAYLFEFPQYLNEERISYLNSSEFVSLLREALFQYDGDYIQEKAMFSLVREENEYARDVIEDVLGLAGYPSLYYMFERHSTLLSSNFLGNLLFELSFFSDASIIRWNAKRALRVLKTSSIPFYRFNDIIGGDFPVYMKNEAMDLLTDFFVVANHYDLPVSQREDLSNVILPYASIPETRDNALRALGALDVNWDYLINELKYGEYTPYLLSALSTQLVGASSTDLWFKGYEILRIAEDSSYEAWRRIYAAEAAYQIGLREWESPEMEKLRNAITDEIKERLWGIYNSIMGYIFDESLYLNLRITALRFSISTGNDERREEIISSVISSGDFSLIQEASKLAVVYNACNSITAFKVSMEDYSNELSAVSFYIDKIEEKALKLEEKLKRKLSVNEDCPKGCKGKNCINCVGIAGKIDQIISKLNEVSEPEIQADINIIKSSFNDLREKVLLYYSLFEEEGVAFESPEPGRYRDVNNELRNDLLSISNRVEELKRKARDEKSREKIKEVLEKISEIDEKLDEMEEAIEDYEEDVEEIIEDSGYRSVSELVNRENFLTSLKLQFENTIESLKAKCGIEGDPPEETSNPSPNPTANTQTIQGDPDSNITVYGYMFTRDGAKVSGIGINIKFVSWQGECMKWEDIPCPPPSGGGCVMVAHAQQTCRRCADWRPSHVATALTSSTGAYVVGLRTYYGYNVYYSTQPNYPYPDIKQGSDIKLGVFAPGAAPVFYDIVNLVFPYPETTTTNDLDHDSIPDIVEEVVVDHHKPWWSFDSKQADGERFFPFSPRDYYYCSYRSIMGICDINDAFLYKNCRLMDSYGNCVYVQGSYPFYEELRRYGEGYYINTTDLVEGEHGDIVPFTTQDVFYNVRWKLNNPSTNQFHIQYYLFFSYNDTEAAYEYGDHFGDWEWLCIYPHQATLGVYPTFWETYKYPYGGRIERMHYHGHGVTPPNVNPNNPSGCNDKCVRCWGTGGATDVNVRRTSMEAQGLHNYIIEWDGPDVPKVWVGDDVHSFWGGYGGVPRDACFYTYCIPVIMICSTFTEHINNCPAPEWDRINNRIKVCPCSCGDIDCERNNNCLRYFTRLHPIEPSVADIYDPTVRDFGGRWGGWGKSRKGEGPSECPHGPTGPEIDRDYYGRYDSYE